MPELALANLGCSLFSICNQATFECRSTYYSSPQTYTSEVCSMDHLHKLIRTAQWRTGSGRSLPSPCRKGQRRNSLSKAANSPAEPWLPSPQPHLSSYKMPGKTLKLKLFSELTGYCSFCISAANLRREARNKSAKYRQLNRSHNRVGYKQYDVKCSKETKKLGLRCLLEHTVSDTYD